MREPRPHQRMPEGGKRLYQALRGDFEPVLIDVFVMEETSRDRVTCANNCLAYSREFDPMLYFWPVDGQHVVVHLDWDEPTVIERLGRALLRDGAMWVSFIVGVLSLKITTRGDANAFWRRRYGTEAPMGPVATPIGGGQ